MKIPGQKTVRSALLALAAALVALPAVCADSDSATASTPGTRLLRGQLQASPHQPPSDDKPLVLVAAGGQEHLITGDEYSRGQLVDPRLAGRTWELEVAPLPDGRWEIQRLFTIKDGVRHVVKYYCEICHIYTHAPGRCMCCQGETELKEIPQSSE